jgi:hypothetical protein
MLQKIDGEVLYSMVIRTNPKILTYIPVRAQIAEMLENVLTNEISFFVHTFLFMMYSSGNGLMDSIKSI